MIKTVLFLLAITIPVVAEPNLANRVRREALDQYQPVEVHVSTLGMTTLQFPEKIQSVTGARLTADPGKVEGDFLVYRGENWYNVQSLKEGAQQNLNVILNGKVYAVVLKTGLVNDFSVVFDRDTPPQADAPPPPKLPTSTRVSGLIDKLMNYEVLKQQPAAYLDMDIAQPKDFLTSTDKVDAQVVRVLRDRGMDPIALDVRIQNKTDAPFRFDPASLNVRVGEEVYRVAMAKGEGSIPAHSEEHVGIALAGNDASGKPANLAVDNKFLPIVEELK